MNHKVIAEHRSNYPNPIEFEVGENLTVGKIDPEYPGWIWVETNTGKRAFSKCTILTAI